MSVSVYIMHKWILGFTTYWTARIVYKLYRHRREMREHLNSFDAELDRGQLLRMLALGCFDTFITLPISITGVVTNVVGNDSLLKFYQGWTFIHSHWEPILTPKSVWLTNKMTTLSVYWDEWINPFIAFVFFALFGLTPEARKGYHKLFRFLRRPFSARQGNSVDEGLPDVVFTSGRGTNATAMSNISSRYVWIPHPANTFELIPILVLKQMSRCELARKLDSPPVEEWSCYDCELKVGHAVIIWIMTWILVLFQY